MRLFAVIPALNERAAIGAAVAMARAVCDGVVVVDGGSHDGTAEAATAAGARVVAESAPGYGRAVTHGARVARAEGAEAYLFLDGNGTIAADDARRVAEPVRAGHADLSLGARTGQVLRPVQRMGNELAVASIAWAWGHRYRDVSSLRAIRADALDGLALRELGYGWPLELLLRAAERELRISEVDVRLLPRTGVSKVSGTVRGTVGASAAYLRVLATGCLVPRLLARGVRP